MNVKHVKCQGLCNKCVSSVHVRCMTNAWASTHEAKCVKHTINDKYMINMHNYDNPQSLVLIGIQNNEKLSFGHFVKHLRVHTLYMYVKQCMNIWKTCLNTCYFCHKGPTFKAHHHLNQNLIKKIEQKISFPTSFEKIPIMNIKTPQKHNLMIKINEKS